MVQTQGTRLWLGGTGAGAPPRPSPPRDAAPVRCLAPSARKLDTWQPGLWLWTRPRAVRKPRGRGGVGQVSSLNGASAGPATHLAGAGRWAPGPQGPSEGRVPGQTPAVGAPPLADGPGSQSTVGVLGQHHKEGLLPPHWCQGWRGPSPEEASVGGASTGGWRWG